LKFRGGSLYKALDYLEGIPKEVQSSFKLDTTVVLKVIKDGFRLSIKHKFFVFDVEIKKEKFVRHSFREVDVGKLYGFTPLHNRELVYPAVVFKVSYSFESKLTEDQEEFVKSLIDSLGQHIPEYIYAPYSSDFVGDFLICLRKLFLMEFTGVFEVLSNLESAVISYNKLKELWRGIIWG